MAIILFILICFSIASFFTQKRNWKIENSILITFLGIGIILYLTGLFNGMILGFYGIVLLGIIAFGNMIYSLWRKKIQLKEILTPNTVSYLFGIAIIVFFLKDTFFLTWDEFSHWGPNLKAMVHYDAFWSNEKYDGVHVVYPPMAGIIEYFFCKLNGGFAEDISYIAINIFIITLLLPFMAKNQKWSVKNVLKTILFWIVVYISIIVFNFEIPMLYIDLYLGILLASGIFYSFHSDEKENKIALILILITLPLFKDTGLLFLGIILMNLFWNKVLRKSHSRKKDN